MDLDATCKYALEAYNLCGDAPGYQTWLAILRFFQPLVIVLTMVMGIILPFVFYIKIKRQREITRSDILSQIFNAANWIEFTTVVLNVYLYIQNENLTIKDLYLQKIASVAVMMMTLNFFFKASSVPWVGLYISMIFSVAKKYLIFFLAFSMILYAYLVALDMSFMGYFGNSEFFSVAKLLGILIGELDLNNLIGNTDFPDFWSKLFAGILLSSFIIIGPIVSATLLIGIVVSDIDALKTNALQKSLCKRLEFIERLEMLCPELLPNNMVDSIDFWIKFGLVRNIEDFIITETLSKRKQSRDIISYFSYLYYRMFFSNLKDAIKIGMKNRKSAMTSVTPLCKFSNCLDELKCKSKTDNLVRQQLVRALSEALECLKND